jgi:hypothetical protein
MATGAIQGNAAGVRIMGPLGVLRTVRGVTSIRKPASPYWDVRAGGLCLLVSGRILHPSSTEMPRGGEAQQLHHVVHTYHKRLGQNFLAVIASPSSDPLSADLKKPCPTSGEGGVPAPVIGVGSCRR